MHILQFGKSTPQPLLHHLAVRLLHQAVARYLRDNLRAIPATPPPSAPSGTARLPRVYRTIYNISALKPIERNDPLRLDGYDYYMLNGDDRAKFAAQHPGSVRIFSDDLSGVIFTK